MTAYLIFEGWPERNRLVGLLGETEQAGRAPGLRVFHMTAQLA